MEKRDVLTKLDGVQTFEFWDKADFKGRVTKFYTGSTTEDMVLETVTRLPDDFIICDFCNEEILEFPVPVFHGHALCPKCYQMAKA